MSIEQKESKHERRSPEAQARPPGRERDPESDAIFAAIHASKAFTPEAAYRAFAGLKRRRPDAPHVIAEVSSPSSSLDDSSS